MAQRLAAALVIVLCAGISSCASRARAVTAPPADWNMVQSLAAGTPVRVDTRWSEAVRGELLGVDDAGVRMRARGRFRTSERLLERTQITRVFRRGDRKTARHARTGALVGLGGGLGVIVTERRVSKFGVAATAWYTAWGAGVGALHGYGSREEILVYVAPTPSAPRQ